MRRYYHWVANGCHFAYFGLVALEAHGYYGIAAGAMLVVLLANSLISQEG